MGEGTGSPGQGRAEDLPVRGAFAGGNLHTATLKIISVNYLSHRGFLLYSKGLSWSRVMG